MQIYVVLDGGGLTGKPFQSCLRKVKVMDGLL